MLVEGDAVQQEVVCEMVALEAGDVDCALLHLPRRQRLQGVLPERQDRAAHYGNRGGQPSEPDAECRSVQVLVVVEAASALRRQLLEAVLVCLRSEHDGVQYAPVPHLAPQLRHFLDDPRGPPPPPPGREAGGEWQGRSLRCRPCCCSCSMS